MQGVCVWLDEKLVDPTTYYEISKLTQKKLQSENTCMNWKHNLTLTLFIYFG